MPRLAVWGARCALVYLLAGFTFGAILLSNKGLPYASWAWKLLPIHIEFLLVGWVFQLILAVTFWILPRFSQEPRRGKEWLAWLAFAGLNLGLLLVGISPFVPAYAALALGGRSLEALAALLFGLHAWPRVKPTGA